MKYIFLILLVSLTSCNEKKIQWIKSCELIVLPTKSNPAITFRLKLIPDIPIENIEDFLKNYSIKNAVEKYHYPEDVMLTNWSLVQQNNHFLLSNRLNLKYLQKEAISFHIENILYKENVHEFHAQESGHFLHSN